MSNQLVKKNPAEGYQNVFPKTFIDAIKDKESGVSLQEILQGFNMYFLSYNGNKALTRCSVPSFLRKEGLWITYVLYDHTVITEWYNSDNIDDESFGSDDNWRRASNMLVGDISVSSDGYWVINGEKTEAKAQGEQGVTPLLKIGANNKLQVSYNAGKEWEDISDYIVPRFRWNQGTGTSAGNVQISMDLGKTWTNLSSAITNNLKISKYIGINESLPTSGIAEGTIYMKGPYYDENDTNNDNPIYRMWIYAWKDNTLAWQDNGEFASISAGVVQETGNSTTQVMSQDAVTRELAKLSEKLIKLVFFGNAGTLNIGEYGYRTDTKKIRYNNNGLVEDVPFLDGAIYTYNNILYVYNGDTLVKSTLTLEDVNDQVAMSLCGNIEVEKGTIITDLGISENNNARARTKHYLIAPFSVKCNSGYLIRNCYRYKIIDDKFVFQDYVPTRNAELNLQDNSYVYRLVFNKSDDTQDIQDSELNDIVDNFTSLIDEINKKIDLNTSNIAELHSNIAELHSNLKDKLIVLKFIGQSGTIDNGEYCYNTTKQKIRYNNNGLIEDIPFLDGAIYTCDNELYVYNGYTLVCVSKHIPRLDLRIGGIQTYAPGDNMDSTMRARTQGYIKPPFSIKVGKNFLTRVINRYKEIDGEITYHSTILQKVSEYAVHSDDGYLYRIAFQKEDDTNEIYEYELGKIISEYKDSITLIEKEKGESDELRFTDIYISKLSNGLPRYYSDVISRYDALAETAPSYVTKRKLGETSKGTALFEFRFTTGNYNSSGRRGIRDAEIEKRKILLMTGIHGYEPGSVVATLRFCEELVGSCNALSELKNVDLIIIPCVNPDGFDARTRTNANGVDINRNFDVNWAITGEGTSYYGGESAASELETQLVQAWLNEHSDAFCCIDFHQSSFNKEISCLGYTVLYEVEGEKELKLTYLKAMHNIANMLMLKRGVSIDSIIGYTYNETIDMHGVSNGYIASKGIKGGCLEVPGNVGGTGNNSDVTIEVATDVIGNVLKSFVE